MQSSNETIYLIMGMTGRVSVNGVAIVAFLSMLGCTALSSPPRWITRNKSAVAGNPEILPSMKGLTDKTARSLLLTATILVSAPLASQAFDAQVFTNDYSDPLHSLCRRHIQVSKTPMTLGQDGTSRFSFQYEGTAVGPKDDDSGVLHGCSKEEIKEFGLRKGSFTGSIVGNRISAGDGIHEGIWEAAGSVDDGALKYTDVDGIRWNDGNKWIVKEKSLPERALEIVFNSYASLMALVGLKVLLFGV